MRRSLVLAVSACLLVTACGEEPEVRGTASSAPPASSSPSPLAPAASAPAEVESAPPANAPVFPADASLKTEEPSGGPLSVTAVRIARQDGYDRVVFELGGRNGGSPGWQVQYVDDPRRDGSGDPVEVAGDATLVVLISGAGYPFDTGVEEAGDADVPAGLELVRDVEVGSVFEGVHEAFIGVAREAPFRVFRLSDPARVVVDVRHG